jgi:hypothetical protein
MSKCVLGRELFRHLEDSSRVASIWEMRRVVPDFEPNVRVSREEATEKHCASRTAFLSHGNDCEECRDFDGHLAGEATGSLFLVASN